MSADNLELREIRISDRLSAQKVEEFLAGFGLRLDDTDSLWGLFDDNDRLCACGGVKDDVIKCVAVDTNMQGLGLSNRLVSHLFNMILTQGYDNAKVYTKPENERMFNSLGFVTIGKSDKAIYLESDRRASKNYIDYLKSKVVEAANTGVIVLNCNPLTKGHLYLIDYARKQTDHLYLIPVGDNDSNMFSYIERRSMLAEATKDMPDVTVLEGSHYAISAATFPSYFIKETSDVARAQMQLDLSLFGQMIAPALGVRKRFVGTEPTDNLTADYNEIMKKILSTFGIKVVEIERKDSAYSHNYISASAIRKGLLHRCLPSVLSDAAPTSMPYILAKSACNALDDELNATPKPGLVDTHDNGAHTDMDICLMRKSINSLYPHFVNIAKLCMAGKLPQASALQSEGIAAEKIMLTATNNVNTHKGAIFSMGLAVAASAFLVHNGVTLSIDNLKNTISQIASQLNPGNQQSHGREVRQRFGVKGAIETAQSGYTDLFDDWLPHYCNLLSTGASMPELRLLLKIMTRLEDTNIYFRGGDEAMQYVKSIAEEALVAPTEEILAQMNREFIGRNLSPGGAADMLALTLFFKTITTLHNNQKSITNG